MMIALPKRNKSVLATRAPRSLRTATGHLFIYPAAAGVNADRSQRCEWRTAGVADRRSLANAMNEIATVQMLSARQADHCFNAL